MLLQQSPPVKKQIAQQRITIGTSHPPRALLPCPTEPRLEPSRPAPAKGSNPSSLIDAFRAKTDDARWVILSSRSCPSSAHPPFIYAVKTTHIYCRPTCPARLARRANIVFFDTAPDAEKAGFRACRRCKPDVGPQSDTGGETVQAGDGEEGRRKVLRAVEIIREKGAQGQRIGLRELSEEVGLSRWHLLRIFRKRWGVTPKEMADGVMNEKNKPNVESGLRTPETVATTVLGSASSAPNAMPRTPEGGIEVHEEPVGAAFDDALMGFDLAALEMDLTAPELWGYNESAEDLLKDLFPEVYQQEAKARR